MFERTVLVSSFVLLAAAFAAGAPASADEATCVFSGGGAGLSPGIQDASADAGLIDVESGSYDFDTATGTAACAGEVDLVPFVAPARIISSGFYDNIICGTGFAHDLSGAWTAIYSGPLNASPGYEIVFAAGVGKLLIGGAGPSVSGTVTSLLPHDSATPPHTHPAKTSRWVGSGTVEITPGTGVGTGQDNCAASPDGTTDAFQIRGFLVMSD